jgi:hypothetical protein
LEGVRDSVIDRRTPPQYPAMSNCMGRVTRRCLRDELRLEYLSRQLYREEAGEPFKTANSPFSNQINTIAKHSAPQIMSSATSFRELIGVSPSTASVADSTLIIIDAQNEYAEGKLKCSNTASSRKVIASLLEKYRQGNGKIVHVVHDTPDGAPVFTPGTKLAEEFDELAPKDGEKVIHKNYPSSFAGTDLHKHLGGGKIVLTGYMVCLFLVLLFF